VAYVGVDYVYIYIYNTERVADVNATPAQRSHLSNKTVKMRDGLQKAESTLATHIRTERIGLNAYLHSRNVPGTDSPRCGCGWSQGCYKMLAPRTTG